MRFNRHSKLYSWLFVGGVAVALYFLNVEVQSYLGRQAIEKTGLANLSFEEASLRSRSEGKLILADVSAIWCSSCRQLDRQVFANPEVKRVIEKRFIFARIEYESEEGERFVERYDVGGFPTLFLIRPDGTVAKKLQVTFSPEEFLEQLDVVGSTQSAL